MNEGFGMKGHIYLKVMRADGTIEERDFPNIVVNDGRSNMASRLVNDITPGSAYDYIGIGIGSTTPVVTQSTLVNEVMARINSSGTAVGSVASFVGAFSISGTTDITEYGLFNKSTTGSMLSRASGTTLNLVSGETLEVTWDITVG